MLIIFLKFPRVNNILLDNIGIFDIHVYLHGNNIASGSTYFSIDKKDSDTGIIISLTENLSIDEKNLSVDQILNLIQWKVYSTTFNKYINDNELKMVILENPIIEKIKLN